MTLSSKVFSSSDIQAWFSSVASRATDPQKQELFARLAQHYRVLAVEVEKAIIAAKMAGEA